MNEEELQRRYEQANKTRYLDKQIFKYGKELARYNEILDDKNLTQTERRSKMKKWFKLQKNPLYEVKMMDQITEKFHSENPPEE